jgi:hypothetical protein
VDKVSASDRVLIGGERAAKRFARKLLDEPAQAIALNHLLGFNGSRGTAVSYQGFVSSVGLGLSRGDLLRRAATSGTR